MSFAVTHPFEEASYPKGVRSYWKGLPEEVRSRIVEMGRQFGYHAMVEGAVPVSFDVEAGVMAAVVDGKHIQSIPAIYGAAPNKYWVDSDLLNYSMAAEPARSARWEPVVALGTASYVISNVGDGAAIDVDTATGNEALDITSCHSQVWVEPGQGIVVSFATPRTEGAELVIGWTSEDGERKTETLHLPAAPVLTVPKPREGRHLTAA